MHHAAEEAQASVIGRPMREELDSLGPVLVPREALFGAQTQRAVENFDLSGQSIRVFPDLIVSLAMVKLAAACAHRDLGLLGTQKAAAIGAACEEIIAGRHHDEFVVDLLQGGAGTSTNMNVNEVVANLALLKLGAPRGRYDLVHPLNDVNMSQSTNDVCPTAARIAIIRVCRELQEALQLLVRSLDEKAVEFDDVMKLGRTQLQDAVPMTLGLEFQAFAVMMAEDVERLREMERLLAEVNLGGTAIGTGINAPPGYRSAVVSHLARIAQIPVVESRHLVEATTDPGAFVMASALFKRVAVKLSKIANDLRLLSSGPTGGLGEISLPPVQPGSTIMPGKVNPVIPEAVNQACFQVMGNDMTVTLAAQAAQLQLNAMQPLLVGRILESGMLMCRAARLFATKCVDGIAANRARCRDLLESSAGVATALTPYLGYETAARVARQCIESRRNVADVVRELGLMDDAQVRRLLSPEHLVR